MTSLPYFFLLAPTVRLRAFAGLGISLKFSDHEPAGRDDDGYRDNNLFPESL